MLESPGRQLHEPAGRIDKEIKFYVEKVHY